MTPSKVLFFLCIAFVAGILLESIVKIPQIFVCGIFVLGIVLVFSSFFYKKLGFVIGFSFLLLAMGILRVQISEFNIANDKLSQLNGKGPVVLTGTIINEPDVRDTTQNLKVQITKSKSTVLVTAKKYPDFKYLDEVKLTGKLEAPMETDDGAPSGSYKNYLMKDGIYSVMNFPKVELISEEHEYNVLSYLYEKVLFCKQKIRESIQNNFLPPQSSILEGTILGDNGAMTSDLKNKLNITGLRHVIAVSGTHVVILGSIIMSLLLALGFWRTRAFYVVVIFICVYIVLTGLPASGVRAGIMGVLFLLSQKMGRQAMSSRIITLACAVMLLINPLLLVYDVGFQLSFLAVLGLIYLEPIIKRFLLFLTKDKGKDLLGIASATFAAQIFTLPIMVYNFGNISFVSPITNLLVLPIVYWLMVFGFLASIIGIFSSVLGWILSVPCWFLLTYFVKVIDFFSQPWAMKTIQNTHWIWLVILYFVIIFFTGFLNRKYRQEFL